MKDKKIKILDTTIRDGSYAIHFQFTPIDTGFLCKALEDAGVGYIEIGHGLGLGANRRYKSSSFTDEEYLESAAGSVKNSKVGMFFIPGIGNVSDIKKAAGLKMDFIRIGTDINEFASAEKYVKLAKSLDLEVCVNLMKSYLLPPEKFGKISVLAKKFGADVIYVVDSAGGMLPEDVEAYVKACVREGSGLKIGFHGHNNLGLANANTLAAYESGALYLDSSLRGIGRSAGNAATEMLAAILAKRGISIGIDLGRIIGAAERYVQPILKYTVSDSSIDVSLGYSNIHSSNMARISEFAKGAGCSPYEVILKLKGYGKSEVSAAALASIKKDLPCHGTADRSGNVLMEYYRETSSRSHINCTLESVSKMADHLNALAAKTGTKRVIRMIINKSLPEDMFVSYYSFHDDRIACGSIEFGDINKVAVVLKAIGKLIDVLILDEDGLWPEEIEKVRGESSILRSNSLFGVYSEDSARFEFLKLLIDRTARRGNADSILVYAPTADLVKDISSKCTAVKNIYLAGRDFESLWAIRNEAVSSQPETGGTNIFVAMEKLHSVNPCFSIFVLLSNGIFTKDKILLKLLRNNGILVDQRSAITISDRLKSDLDERGIKVVRNDHFSLLSGMVAEILKMDKRV